MWFAHKDTSSRMQQDHRGKGRDYLAWKHVLENRHLWVSFIPFILHRRINSIWWTMALPLLLIVLIHLNIVLSEIEPEIEPCDNPQFGSLTGQLAVTVCYVCLDQRFPSDSPDLIRSTPGRHPKTVPQWAVIDGSEYFANKGCPAMDEFVRSQFRSDCYKNHVANTDANALGSWVKHTGTRWYPTRHPQYPYVKTPAWERNDRQWDASRRPIPLVYVDKEDIITHKMYPKIPIATYLFHDTKGFVDKDDYTPLAHTPCGAKQYALCTYETFYFVYILTLDTKSQIDCSLPSVFEVLYVSEVVILNGTPCGRM